MEIKRPWSVLIRFTTRSPAWAKDPSREKQSKMGGETGHALRFISRKANT